jgi:hypothetical protein
MKNYTKKLKNELQSIEKELLSAPQGTLTKKGKYLYQNIDRKETGITTKPKLIKQLCRKKYLLARKQQILKNANLRVKECEKFDNRTTQEIIDSLPNAYQNLPISYFYHPNVERWVTMDYPKHPYPPTKRDKVTKNGVTVRSKSELLIANELELQNIPYRYEATRMVDNKNEYPDFTIANPFTGKIIIWEHFGALNLKDYEEKMNDKMDTYLRSGYVPNDTMIYTFEFQVQNAKRIQEIIENVIL